MTLLSCFVSFFVSFPFCFISFHFACILFCRFGSPYSTIHEFDTVYVEYWKEEKLLFKGCSSKSEYFVIMCLISSSAYADFEQNSRKVNFWHTWESHLQKSLNMLHKSYQLRVWCFSVLSGAQQPHSLSLHWKEQREHSAKVFEVTWEWVNDDRSFL